MRSAKERNAAAIFSTRAELDSACAARGPKASSARRPDEGFRVMTAPPTVTRAEAGAETVSVRVEGPPSGLRRASIAPALLFIRLYQVLLSPLLGPACRFEPSCSRYMAEALKRYGLLRGGVLGARRLLRCHPWGGSGVDPVP